MRAVRVLEEEHRRIQQALVEVTRALEPLDREALERSLVFLSTFVDRVHHAKEENVLFRAMLADSLDLALGPIQHLHKEHDLARAYLRAALRALPEAGEDSLGERARLAAAVRAYTELMQSHLQKEERLIFPLAERTLRPDQDQALLDRYEQIAREAEALAGVELPQPPQMDARTLDGAVHRTPSDEIAISARAGGTLYDDGRHQALWLHDFGHGLAVQANHFVIVHGDQGMILDPGGPKVYPDVYAETMLRLAGGKLRYIFLSHQDPDIVTSLNAWLMDTDAEAYISKLWVRFLPHFGIDRLLSQRLKPIPDQGMKLDLGGAELLLVPAHYLHSPGNFQVYDPIAKILFTGDLGASLSEEASVVEDFDAHVPTMVGFHRRYMASRRAARKWARVARELDIEAIAPQHGPIFRGKPMVERFIRWCEEEPCGVDLID